MQKTCRKCGLTFESAEAFFRLAGVNSSWHRKRRPTCIGCELTARTDRKRKNRPKEKARRTWHHHADKYLKTKPWLDNPNWPEVRTRSEFADVFGWDDLDQIAHDIKHAAINGCPYCHRMFSEMEHGLADVTLDIVDPRQSPYYGVNTKWVCMTCNREKQKTPPELWGAKLRCWKKWRELQEKLKTNPFAGLPLFEYGNN